MRLTSLNIGYNIGVSLVGGFSPAIATALVDSYDATAAGLVVSALAVLAWIGLIFGITSESEVESDTGVTGKKNLSSTL